MRVTIFGVGAVGGHLAVRLCALSDVTVSVIARGDNLAAIRTHGLLLKSAGQDLLAHPIATDSASSLPIQDVVFVALKAQSLPAAAAEIAQLLGPTTDIVFLLNGIPWWMVKTDDGISRLDPDGLLQHHVGRERVLGGVVFSSNSVESPGVIRHDNHDRWIIGEATAGEIHRVERVVALLRRAGLAGERAEDIHRDIWSKLILNASCNPIGALTRLAPGHIVAEPSLADLALKLRNEIASIASAMGHSLEDLAYLSSLDDIAHLPPIQPSMLQDAIAKRPMEVDAILAQPVAFARQFAVAVPTLEIVLSLLTGLDSSRYMSGWLIPAKSK